MGIKKQLRITCDTTDCQTSYTVDGWDDQMRALAAAGVDGWIWTYNPHGLDVRCAAHRADFRNPGTGGVISFGNHR